MTIKITDFNPASYQTELPTQLYLYMYSISFICFVFIILYGGVCFITKFCFYILMFLYHSVDAVRGGGRRLFTQGIWKLLQVKSLIESF